MRKETVGSDSLEVVQSRRFVGRRAELARLRAHLDAVMRTGSGRLLSVRGRRQVGKSRLLSEFVARSRLPALYSTATRQATVEADLAAFAADVAERSTLPGRAALGGIRPPTWEAALRVVIGALPTGPALLVLDEVPWWTGRDSGFEGALQRLWDTELEARPVLVVLVGSDLSVMERLTAYDRPLYGRAKELVVGPFSPADTAEALGSTDAASALDDHLVTGGLPRLLLERREHPDLDAFVTAALHDEFSDLVTVGLRVLDAEVPPGVQARALLSVIGSGERSFANLQRLLGIPATSLHRSLSLLRGKRLVAGDVPLSTTASRETRWRIADPSLRFWARFVEPAVPDAARGRGDLAVERFRRDWPVARGRLVEPLVREAVLRLAAGDERLGGVGAVGGWWNRSGDVEVDLVGADRAPVARRVTFIGSIRWRERAPFDRRDLAALHRDRARVPGAEDAALVAVSRSRVDAEVDVALTPEELLDAWRA